MAERKEMADEAVKRMHALGLMPKIIDEFKRNGTLYYSERSSLGGILYWMTNNPEWMSLVQTFENKYNCLVYHVTHEYTVFGEELTLLYVPSDTEDWALEMENILHREPEYGHVLLANVVNLSDYESEFGSVGVREAAGGLIRTA